MAEQLATTPDEKEAKSYHDSFRARARTAATLIIGGALGVYTGYKFGDWFVYNLTHPSTSTAMQECIDGTSHYKSCEYNPPEILTAMGAGAVSCALGLAEALQLQKDDNGNYVDNWGPYPARGGGA